MKKTDESTFTYYYSAAQQEEIEQIRRKYIPQEENKLERLRRLDRSVGKKGMAVSVLLGAIGSLVLGVGMCCCLVWDLMLVGTAVGVIGIVLIGLAYPVKQYVTKKERERIAPEILRLTEELSRKQ